MWINASGTNEYKSCKLKQVQEEYHPSISTPPPTLTVAEHKLSNRRENDLHSQNVLSEYYKIEFLFDFQIQIHTSRHVQ